MIYRVGTSGWHYPHWRGPFYPPDLPVAQLLAFYAARFDTVEVNNFFYRLPTLKAVDAWRDGTPPGFLFAIKGSRFLTHMKKLKDPAEGLGRMLPVCEELGQKLGPILFQLPPRWGKDAGRLDEFLAALPRTHRYAFELRDPSWHASDVLAVLRRHAAAFCQWELAGVQSPLEITADIAYVRLHGPGGPYQGSYSRGRLATWAKRIRAWERELRGIYIYFDNDQAGYAAHDAQALRRMLAG
ncbi:MAG TPA: DUF72 domain-containing protein [Polyangia bacterium]